MALTKKDQEYIAQMVASTVAAMLPTLGGAQAPSKAADEEPVEDEAAEEAAIAEQKAAQANEHARMLALVDELTPLILPPRNIVVLDWMCSALGKDRAAVFTAILRSAIAKELPAWREAQGKGGSSTKNPDTIAALARLREENQ